MSQRNVAYYVLFGFHNTHTSWFQRKQQVGCKLTMKRQQHESFNLNIRYLWAHGVLCFTAVWIDENVLFYTSKKCSKLKINANTNAIFFYILKTRCKQAPVGWGLTLQTTDSRSRPLLERLTNFALFEQHKKLWNLTVATLHCPKPPAKNP